MSVVGRLSAAEFIEREWPRGTQLLDGAVVMNEPTPRHQELCLRLLRALADWRDSHDGWGQVTPSLTLVMGDDRPAPDVMWFSRPLADQYAPQTPRVPELVVEVRSPSTWSHDLGRKRELYERHGVAEYWLVDDLAELVVRLTRSTPAAPQFDVEQQFRVGESVRSDLLPGFSLDVAALFAARVG
jgi:Uma2 family endonuclease